MATANPPPPRIPEALRLSTQTWQHDLLQLFHNAKDRFPDVVWELHSDDDHDSTEGVWGYKGEHGRRRRHHQLILAQRSCMRVPRRCFRRAASPFVLHPSRPRRPIPPPCPLLPHSHLYR